MTAVGLLVAAVGLVLITAGIRDQDPREMILGAVQGNPTARGSSSGADAPRTGAINGQPTDYGPPSKPPDGPQNAPAGGR